MTGKAVVDRLCSRRGENFGERSLIQIAQGKHSVGIETAGHYRAVTVYADLIPQPVAEEGGVFGKCGSGKIGPIELLAPLQKEFVGKNKSVASSYRRPLPGEGGVEGV